MNPQITPLTGLKYPANWFEALRDPTGCFFKAFVRSVSPSSQDGERKKSHPANSAVLPRQK
jgi:hypothetical protein